PEPEPEPEPEEEEEAPASSSGSTGYSGVSTPSGAAAIAVNAALAQVGKPYGHDNDGTNWDCNGLTHYAWSVAGVSIPYASGHYAYGQFQWLKSSGNWVTSASQLKAGDLVFFSYDGGATTFHVAMYIGGGQIVHAIGYSMGVQVTSLSYVSGFCGGGSPY
ncbi:MAG: NlpC/P60 family protein, partial [Atopobiaceae bacterium]|nr:NlpC/P60 family protein [Atopobiaceae bacterium]